MLGYGDSCVLVQTAIFVSLVARHVVYAGSVSGLREAREKLVVWADLERLECWAYGPALSLALEKLQTGVSFQLYDTVLRVGIMARDCLGFCTGFDVSGFTFTLDLRVSELVSGLVTNGICLYIFLK